MPRFASVQGGDFYRGLVDAGNKGVALLFASERQLSLLEASSCIFFDATFKVVPSIFYQMLTIFATHGDGVSGIVRGRESVDVTAGAELRWSRKNCNAL